MRSILLCIGSWPCAALPLEVQINQETLRIEDLADVEMRAPIDGMRDQGFTILRDMLQGDVIGESLLRRRHDEALYRLREPILERLGFDGWYCGENIQNLSMPTLPDAILSFMKAFPMALPKIILLFRRPLRPFAVRQLGMNANATWWHSEMTGGDALVVDQMRSMDMVVQVGEEGLQEAQKAAQRLQAALQSQAKSLQAQDAQDTRNTQDTGSFEAATREVPKVCGDVELLKALDYPRLGDTYNVHLRPALLRRFEAVESDLLGEVRLGKTVTILKHGTESPGRVQVYTEDALVMPGYISDEIDVSTAGISGWISSTTYNGTRLLVQGHLKETPVVETTRLELASVVLGTCEWFQHLQGHADVALRRAQQRLAAALAAANPSRTAMELQCVAVRYPNRAEMLLVVVTLVTLFFGCVIFSALSAASAY